MALEKIVVIKKLTKLEELLKKYTTVSQVKFFLESRGDLYSRYKEAHLAYEAGLKQTLAAIPSQMRQQVVDKEHLQTFQFGEKELIVTVGGDGLVANVAKYAGAQPILAVNADFRQFGDALSCCNPKTFPGMLQKTLENAATIQQLTMAEARLDDGQVMYALNDLFIGRATHISAHYLIEHKNNKERQSSDGIIVSTGTGSTAWLTSIITGANAIAAGSPRLNNDVPFPGTAGYLIFAVNNPFPSKTTGTSIVYGCVIDKSVLRVVSGMSEQGVIFSDGIESDYLDFTAGKTALIQPAKKKVCLVVGCGGV